MRNLKTPTRRSNGLVSSWLLLTLLLASAVSVGWAAWDVYGPGPVALRDRPIQNIRVGERVWGTNPQRAEYDRSFPEPEAATWRLVRLVMHQPEGETLRIELLRPTGWINEQGAAVGRTIELNLPELGAAGPAEVLAIEPCPPIQPGPGQVVTGTFAHRSSRQILNLQVAGEQEPIGVTDNHPIWSATRQEFVEAGKLEVGEELLTLAGTTHVTSIAPRGPPEPVYNLEVQGEHVYLVASSGVLVHNSYEVVDGVRRAKANELAGNTTIRARIQDANGRIIGERDIPLNQLRSPHKDSIRMTSLSDQQRWQSIVDGLNKGDQIPPITVTAGHRGASIGSIFFDFGGNP